MTEISFPSRFAVIDATPYSSFAVISAVTVSLSLGLLFERVTEISGAVLSTIFISRIPVKTAPHSS